MCDLVVAGAGMAGLVCAAQARERGARVALLEKASAPGGSMLLSSGYIWRYRDWGRFRSECPQGDPKLQRLLHERLDADLAWLESLGAPVKSRDTQNPLTYGCQFDTAGLTAALCDRVGAIRCETPLRAVDRSRPVVLATGGFQANRRLVARYITPHADRLILRASAHSTGDGMRLGLAAGGRLGPGLNEFYGRNLPAPPARVEQSGFVDLAQVYARHATVENARGQRYVPQTWSEIDVVQWTARQPGARAWYRVADAELSRPIRERTVADAIDAAREAGALVTRQGAETILEVVAGITTTLGGLVIDTRTRVGDGVYAAGTDAGGIATGGYASGLAAALVFGRIACDAALGLLP